MLPIKGAYLFIFVYISLTCSAHGLNFFALKSVRINALNAALQSFHHPRFGHLHWPERILSCIYIGTLAAT